MSDTIQSQDKEKKANEDYSKNFARIPNMLFVSYKLLTKEEKFLYCTLKSVYWDTRPRYVSLRELSEMTNYSTGALSKMIPRLHACALVHAEIRREKDRHGKECGNAKFNITILDIWELNQKYFSCSVDERDLLDPSQKLVHEMNEPVQQMNKPVHEKRQGRSRNEHVRAQPKLTKESIKTSLKTNKKDVVVSTQSSQQENDNDSSFSVSSSSRQSTPEEQQSNKPAVGGNDRETQHACFKDEVEQAIWDTERAANIVKRNRPAPADREHVADIAESLRKHNFPVEQYTVEFVKNVWDWKMDCNPNLKNDCKLANHVTAVPEYILAGMSDTLETASQSDVEGDATNKVIWTREPDQAFSNGPIASKSYIELFERMSEEDAEKYGYGYYPGLSFDELDRIKSYLARGK